MNIVKHNPQVAVPTLNINGTDGNDLLSDNRAAAKAINDAFALLLKTAPHGRDYQGRQDEFHKARAEHSARLSALTHIIAELDMIAFSIRHQLDQYE